MSGFIDIIDVVFFILFAVQVIYLFIFATANLFVGKYCLPRAKYKYSFLVIFPAYKEDEVIINSVTQFLTQDYPSESCHVVVVADRMEDGVNNKLSQLGVEVMPVAFENSSKAKALRYAMDKFNYNAFDKVLILDADNVVDADYLNKLNDCFAAGSEAIQTHRKAKNLNTHVAVLDALSEEINNSIFRRGHVMLGFSSALIGSGMAFDFNWYKKHVGYLQTSGEDKELEALLFKNRIYVDFLDDAIVYDEKTANVDNFNNQRHRWLSVQFSSLIRGLKDLPSALFERNRDYVDKLVQWAMLPRIILIMFIVICAFLTALYEPFRSVKWCVLLFFLFLSLAFATPDELVNKDLRKAFRSIPVLGLKMFFNLFRIRNGDKNFIHTKHSI